MITIPFQRRASASASADLPEAVGPVTTRYGGAARGGAKGAEGAEGETDWDGMGFRSWLGEDGLTAPPIHSPGRGLSARARAGGGVAGGSDPG
ncbi:hypothetical protein ROR02_28100 [Pararhodospirillum oryzae]|uniref:Uncharacterized protein n=1 Tax=Pararhodospirillum oryzae TaxID=478448 RepID=A0A512HB58_9PROT|nr:hypothetical protein ROR02_28100 [Pararhodospirillum oryzae]